MLRNIALLEGLLFISGDDGTTIEDIMFVLELKNKDEVHNLITELINKYKKDETSGLDIQKFAGNKYRLMTKKIHSEYYTKLESVKTETKLSNASIETLSIIAYKGPITKSSIEDIRGVNCDGVIYKLLLRNLIKKDLKQKALGGASLYETTDEFMKYFNINSLSELPELKQDTDETRELFDR